MREIKIINGRKICSRCEKNKRTNQFYKSPNTKSGLTSACKQCKKKYEQSDEAKHLSWKRHLKYLYKISETAYNKCFQEQGGCCGVCKQHQSTLQRRLDADHDHKTGEFRGLLCNYCNKIVEKYINNLSHFKDQVIIDRIVDYLI